MGRLRVGILGYGIVGRKREEVIRRNSEYQIIAICDKTFEEKNELVSGVQYFKDYRDCLKIDLDVVFVCLSNDVVADATLKALRHGAHVFCEKPPARTLDELKEVGKEIKKSKGQRLMYGFNHRYHGSVIDAKSIIDTGVMGQLISIRGLYGKSKIVTYDQTIWRTERAKSGGGILLDQGIHMLDLMRYFGGEFYNVQSVVSNKFWDFDVEDNVAAILTNNNGLIASLSSSATQWRHRFNLELMFANGCLLLEGILSGSKSYGDETLRIIRRECADGTKSQNEEVRRYTQDNSWQSEVDLFAKSIMEGKDIVQGCYVDAYETLRLVFMIYFADPEWRNKYNIKDPVGDKP